MIIDFICDTKYEDIPDVVLENAKGRILDTLGVTFKGATASVGDVVKKVLRELDGKEQVTAVALNLKTDLCNAAFANGTLMHAIDFDDHFILSHPSIGVLPALLPVAELTGASGKDVLTAFVIGIEIYTKVQQCTSTEPWYRGFHATGVWTSLSSVAAAGKLLKFNKEQMLMAWGIACSCFAGIKRNQGTMTKPYHCGRSAEGGVRAAIMAKNGYESHPEAFEGRFGWLYVFCSKPRLEFIEQLGKDWDLDKTPTLIKPHPSCGGTHAAMNGMLELINKHDIREEDVERIDVGMNQGGVDSLYYPDPKDIYEAKFSMHFCMALLIHYRRWGLSLHTNEVVLSPAMKALYPKVHFRVDEALDKEIDRDYTDYHALVDVTLKNGVKYHIRSQPPRLTFQQIKDKFYDCCDGVLPKDRSDKIVDTIVNLEKLNYNEDLLCLLV
jgi:2-methylcitrate dehydratase PrpD